MAYSLALPLPIPTFPGVYTNPLSAAKTPPLLKITWVFKPGAATNDAVLANEADTALEAEVANEALVANEADTAWSTYEAV